MLKCNIKRNRGGPIKACGTAEDLMAEVGVVIKKVYQAIHKQNPEAAKEFKNHLIGLLLDPKSPVWKEKA